MLTRPPLPKGTIGVLVVEDDALLLVDTANAFTKAGMVVFEAQDADDAVAILAQRNDIRVVVTDLDMPTGRMSGRQLVDAVVDRWPDVGVVILSGAGEARPRLLPDGMRFLHKPSSPGDLVSTAFAVVSRLTGSL